MDNATLRMRIEAERERQAEQDEWRRAAGKLHSIIASRCDNCGDLAQKAWSNGDIVLCDDCFQN